MMFLIAEPIETGNHVNALHSTSPKDGTGAGDALVRVRMRVDHPLFHCSSEKLPSCKDGGEAEGKEKEKGKPK